MNFLQQKPLNVLLIGDSCTDEYIMGRVNRLSPEAPVPILHYENTVSKLGMSYNVLKNLEALNCNVIYKSNKAENIIKRRFIDSKSNYQLLRQDIEQPLEPIEIKLEDLHSIDAVVISDYCKGSVDHNLAYELCNKYKFKVFVDSKRKDLSCFPYSFIKLNEQESTEYTALPRSSQVITTLGSKGASWNGITYKTKPTKVHDVTGAGDVFLAAFTVFYTLSGSVEEAITKSIKLATKSVQHFGIYTLTDDDIRSVL